MSVATAHILKPSGILTATTSNQLLQEFQDCLGMRPKAVLVDLKEVTFIDSAGLGTLVSLHTRLRLAGGKLYLCSLNDQAKGLMDIADLDQVFEWFEDREEFQRRIG